MKPRYKNEFSSVREAAAQYPWVKRVLTAERIADIQALRKSFGHNLAETLPCHCYPWELTFSVWEDCSAHQRFTLKPNGEMDVENRAD